MNDIMEVKSAAEALACAFETYKDVNDERLAAIERKGGADPLLDDKLSRISGELNRLQTTVTQVKTAQGRPATPTGSPNLYAEKSEWRLSPERTACATDGAAL